MTYSINFNDIQNYSKWTKIDPLNKGWSTDKKFYIETASGERMLLRLSDISLFEHKKWEYENLKKVSALGIKMTEPLELGVCDNQKYVYMLLSWLDGDDAEESVTKYDDKKQYELGVEAGEILRRIHSIPAPEIKEEWETRYEKKINLKIQNYMKCPFKFDNDADFIEFLQKKTSCLYNRPQTFQHGDFHLGNLIITKDHKIGVIDFNRCSHGDPWEEFDRINLSSRVSIPFAVGQIHGYFNNNIPDDFFRLMSLYITNNAVSSIPWAVEFGADEVRTMVEFAKNIHEYYQGFKCDRPLWYSDPV